MEKSNLFIKQLISRMTIDQKVGAMMTLGLSGTTLTPMMRDMILKYHCGGLRCSPHCRRFGSYVDPNSKATIVEIRDTSGYKDTQHAPNVTMEEYREFLDQLQEMAMSRPCGIPLHLSVDQEGDGGNTMIFDGTVEFPMHMGITASADNGLAYEVGLAVARQLRAMGFNWIHSPVLDVNVVATNPEIQIRAFSDNVDKIAEFAGATCMGYSDGGVIACGKHFPGRGDSAQDAHFGIPVIDVSYDQLINRDLLPYRTLIEEGLLPSIMLAHSIYPAIDPDDVSTVSKKVITGLIREELKYDGVITTDSMTMGGIATRYGVPQACAMSLAAGADIVLMKADNELVDQTFSEIKKHVENGTISAEELDNKVYRLLNMKYESGLFNYGNKMDETPREVNTDPRVVKLAQVSARRAVQVVRDRKKNLPLKADKPVLVIEQVTGHWNKAWHPGILFDAVRQYNEKSEYLEIGFSADESDIERIKSAVAAHDTIIITNYFGRGKKANIDIIRDTILSQKGKTVILVTNVPYPLAIPSEADSVIVTFGMNPNCAQVAAGTIFGKVSPEGQWPLDYKLDA